MSKNNSLSGPVDARRGAALFILAFKAVLWLNAVGLLIVAGLALDLFSFGLPAYWLRLPLSLFLAGITLAGVALLWTGLAWASTRRQLLSGCPHRGHWIPGLFAVLAYGFALVVFAAGCWATLGVLSVSQMYDDVHGEHGQVMPWQWPQ